MSKILNGNRIIDGSITPTAIPTASVSTSGILSQADYIRFNTAATSGGGGSVTSSSITSALGLQSSAFGSAYNSYPGFWDATIKEGYYTFGSSHNFINGTLQSNGTLSTHYITPNNQFLGVKYLVGSGYGGVTGCYPSVWVRTTMDFYGIFEFTITDATYSSFSSSRCFVGFTAGDNANLVVNSDTSDAARIGFEFSTLRGDTAWQATARNSSAGITLTPYSFTHSGNTLMYRGIINYSYATNTAKLKLYQLDHYAGTTILDEKTITTNLPNGSAIMYPAMAINTSSGANRMMFIHKMYYQTNKFN